MFWQHADEGTRGWHGCIRIARLEVGFHVYRHSYPTSSPDRWVFQPFFVYDRKGAA